MNTPANNIQLRSVSEDDLSIFFQQQCEPEACRMAAFPTRAREAFIAHWKKILADKTPVRTAVVDGQVAGYVISWRHECKRLVGYWFGKQFWGRGVATRALSEYLRTVTDRPLYARVEKQNVASIRVLEKCGFSICDEVTAALDDPADGVDELVFRLNDSENG